MRLISSYIHLCKHTQIFIAKMALLKASISLVMYRPIEGEILHLLIAFYDIIMER